MRIILSALVMLLLVSSCGINNNLMFRSPIADEPVSDSIPMRPLAEYRLAVDDKFTFSVFENNGQNVIDNQIAINKEAGINGTNEYLIGMDGTVDLPVIGVIKCSGLTVKDFQDSLAIKFSKNYKRPYVQVRITNQRVIVFPGNGSDAKVIQLQNNNTTLMEAIALAGGIADRGKAKKVKLMRLINGKRIVYVLDLSNIEGLKFADLVVQANDYIYVEPSEDLGKEIVQNIAPIFSLISSSIVIFTVLLSFK